MAARVALALFLMDSVQVGAKGFQVNLGVQSNQRVAHLGQLVCPFGYIRNPGCYTFLIACHSFMIAPEYNISQRQLADIECKFYGQFIEMPYS